ncbi:MAG: hypothetical protein LLF76_07460 [Planctomycetaceae bacterium]|nr:hypothetical protein [Planctomycetaceae bacterium]
MRKLLGLVMIMIFCADIASTATIIVISDSGYFPAGATQPEFNNVNNAAWFQDSAMVDYLKSLGYTVDTSGMGGHYRDVPISGDTHWTVDSTKIAALNNADLIIMSRYAASGSYDGDRKAWNELTVPILSQSGQLCRGGATSNTYWGWCNGANTNTNLLEMPLLMGHELVDGFGQSITLFSAIPSGRYVANPAAAATWDARTSIIGTLNNLPTLVDIPTGTDFDALCGRTDSFYGISGARRIYLGHWGYDAATADYSWSMNLTETYKSLFAQVVVKAMSPVKILSNSPANGAAVIPVNPAAPENDLVFTILDSNITAVDVYLGTLPDPNLTIPQNQIANDLTVTTGQNTVDLVGEITGNLSAGTTYYWRVAGLEPNAITGLLDSVGKGPVWKFTTAAAVPAISAVSPAKVVAGIGDPNAIFSVTGENIETYQWYKEGVGSPLSNGTDYSGVDTDTLVINDIGESDFGYYYCVGSKTGFSSVTSTPSGQLEMKGLVHYFPFDSAASNITLDVIGQVQAQLIGGASIGTDDPNRITSGYLHLNNAGATAEDAQYATLNGSIANYPDITISAWFRQDSRDIGPIWDFGQNTNNYFTFTPGYKEGVAKVEFRYQLEGGVQRQDENEVTYTRTGNWQFVTVTFNSEGQSKIYVDGEYRASDSSEANLTGISKTLNYIGFRIYPNLPKFNGVIDELKVYNYVLSAPQIAQEYTNVMGGYVCSEGYDVQAYDYDHDCRVDMTDLSELLSNWLEHDRIYRP